MLARRFTRILCSVCFAGTRNVLEQLLDQIDVGKDHAAAAVAGKTELIESITVRRLC